MKFEFSQDKNEILYEERGVTFINVIESISEKGVLLDIKHPNKQKYPNQRILLVNIENYTYRVPFTADYDLFKAMGILGKELADLHLLKSKVLDSPIAKYQGSGDNDRVEKITYKEDEQRIYINNDKYFEGITPEVWNYHIGGYQVLQKYLKDRKGRIMDDVPRYCRIITALSKTIDIQEKIDEIYPEIEKELFDF